MLVVVVKGGRRGRGSNPEVTETRGVKSEVIKERTKYRCSASAPLRPGRRKGGRREREREALDTIARLPTPTPTDNR